MSSRKGRPCTFIELAQWGGKGGSGTSETGATTPFINLTTILTKFNNSISQ